MARILVTGAGGPAGRNVSQLLLARGHAVIATDMREMALPGATFYRVPAATAPDFFDALREIARQEQVDALVPTVSEELPLMAGQAGRWDPAVRIVIGPYPAVWQANDKYLTGQCLAQAGVAVPRFMLPSEATGPDAVASRVGWPCISKPRVGRGGREVVIRSEADWPAVSGLGDAYVLQEFLDGVDYAPELCLAPGGLAVVVVLEKTKLKGGLVGNAESVARVEAPDVAALALAAAAGLGLAGPADVDIRRGRDGRPAVLEVNARFGANIAHAPEVLDAMLAGYGLTLAA